MGIVRPDGSWDPNGIDPSYQNTDGTMKEDNNVGLPADINPNGAMAQQLLQNRAKRNTVNPNSPQQPKIAIIPGERYQVNDAAFYSSNQNYEIQAQQQAAAAQNRQAFQMQAAQLGPTAQASAAQIAANERSGNINIGQTQNANAAQLGAADQMGYANINRQDMEGRAGQQQLIAQLQAQANGAAPSVAGGQLAAAQDRATQQAMSTLASVHGGGSASLTQRNAMNSLSQSNQQAAHDAAQMRIQEQLSAQGQLGNQLGNMRQQDIGVNTSQAQFQQQALANNQQYNNQFMLQNNQNSQQANMYDAQAYNQRQQDQAAMNMQNQQFNAGQSNARNLNQAQFQQAAGLANQSALNNTMLTQGQFQQAANTNNLQSSVTNQQMNDANQQYWTNQAINQNTKDVQSAQALESLRANQSVGVGNTMQAQQAADQANSRAFMGMGLQAGGALIGAAALASDVRSKEHISSGDDEIHSLLDALNAHQYNYKEPFKEGRGTGTFLSPMAQEFEKSKLGREMVSEKDGTKMVEYGGHNLGTLWAALATINQDVKDLKSKKGS